MASKKTIQQGMEDVLVKAPVIPVLVIERLADAVPLAKALVKGGLPVLEITLRTAVAVEAMRLIMAEVEGAIVGAGTVLTPRQLEDMDKLGCAFAVSPGSTKVILRAAKNLAMPLLPAAVTATEVMYLLEKGYIFQKFFPAEPAGGAAYLKAISAPIPQVRFCPTGGITAEVAPKYLALPNVLTVGGSWMVPQKALGLQDWLSIEKLASTAASLKN